MAKNRALSPFIMILMMNYNSVVSSNLLLNKKRLLSVVLLVFVALSVYSQRVGVDTIYYDKDWSIAPHKAFATYYRVVEINTSKHSKSLRDYYISGELRGERKYISLDYSDDNKSIFDGESFTYYKNGLIRNHCYLKEGKLYGVCSTFTEDGSVCNQVEYNNGYPIHDYALITTQNGCVSKVRLSDNTPIWSYPKETDRKIEYKDGDAWSYYNLDGLIIKMKMDQVKEYGKWYQVSICFVNNSIYTIDFNPDNIKAFLKKKEDKYEIKVLPVAEYIKLVKRKQNLNLILAGIAEGFAAAGAGYSSSTTHSSTSFSANSVINGNAYAYVPGAYAYAKYNINGTLNGTSNTTSTTYSYNGAAAYQASIIASNRIANYANSMDQERSSMEMGYLKRTTVYSGEAVIGYVNVEFKKGSELQMIMKINNVPFKFVWHN